MSGSPLRERIVRMLALAAFVGLTLAGLTKISIDTGVESFVPADDPTLKATTEVAESFGGDPIIVLLESDQAGALLSKEVLPALVRLEGELANTRHVSAVYGPGTVLNQIAGQAQDVLSELVGARDGIQAAAEKEAREGGAGDAEATAAGKRAVEQFDERYRGLITEGLPAGLPTLNNEKFASNVVFNQAGQPRPQWDFVVPTERAAAILVRPDANLEQRSTERLVGEVRRIVRDTEWKDTRVTIAGIPTVIGDLGDQIRTDVVLLGGLAVVGVGAWFWFMPWAKRRRRLIPLAVTVVGSAVTLAAAGWLGIPMSLGVVAFLPVLLGVGSDFMVYLISRVPARLVLTAAAASAAGFAALGLTPISAARQLGLVLAVGVLVTAVVGVVATRWVGVDSTPPTRAEVAPTSLPRSSRVLLAAVAFAVAGAGWWSLSTLRLDADLTSIASSVSSYEDVERVEQVMGSSGEVAVVLRGENTSSNAALQWMRATENDIVANYGDELQPVLSPPQLLNFLGAEPTDSELASGLRLLPNYLRSSVIRNDNAMSVMSYSVRVTDAQQLQRIRDDVRSVLNEPPDGMTVDIIGLPVVAVSSYESLSNDRYLNAGAGIVAAGIVLLVLLRSRRDAVLAMAAAALTTGFVLAGMKLLDIGLSPLTAAVGSLAAAVACEFTVVLAAAARRGEMDRSVFLAATACALGYAVLALSGLSVVSDFGLLLAVTVVIAAVTSHLAVRWFGTSTPPVPASTTERITA